MKSTNLLRGIPHRLPNELHEILLARENLRIERIVSRGHMSAADFWYDQQETEWVVVLAGSARLCFEEDGQIILLETGDSLLIPAHTRHRVDWTDPDQDTIWLAVFCPETSKTASEGEARAIPSPAKA